MRIYLSYPMSGQEGHGIPRATRIAESLRRYGYDLVVPHEIKHGTDGDHFNPDYGHGDYIREDVRLGMLADGVGAIALVNGWTQSRGCMAEFQIAVAMGFRVLQVVEEYELNGRLYAYLLPLDGKGNFRVRD